MRNSGDERKSPKRELETWRQLLYNIFWILTTSMIGCSTRIDTTRFYAMVEILYQWFSRRVRLSIFSERFRKSLWTQSTWVRQRKDDKWLTLWKSSHISRQIQAFYSFQARPSIAAGEKSGEENNLIPRDVDGSDSILWGFRAEILANGNVVSMDVTGGLSRLIQDGTRMGNNNLQIPVIHQ